MRKPDSKDVRGELTGAAELTKRYNREFFAEQRVGALASARVVAPIVVELARPRSVIDIGCGIGAWLAAFRELGIQRIRGIDGDYVDRNELLIPSEYFEAADLSRPLELKEKYDLAVCVEVAEHLPPASARPLVWALTEAAPLVIFSAAIPGQGGVEHVNEQPPRYWDALFAECGFLQLDVLRPRIREDRRVEWYYRQNIRLFVRQQSIGEYPALVQVAESSDEAASEWIHVVVYDTLLRRLARLEGPLPLHRVARELPAALFRCARRLLLRAPNPNPAPIGEETPDVSKQAQDNQSRDLKNPQ